MNQDEFREDKLPMFRAIAEAVDNFTFYLTPVLNAIVLTVMLVFLIDLYGTWVDRARPINGCAVTPVSGERP